MSKSIRILCRVLLSYLIRNNVYALEAFTFLSILYLHAVVVLFRNGGSNKIARARAKKKYWNRTGWKVKVTKCFSFHLDATIWQLAIARAVRACWCLLFVFVSVDQFSHFDCSGLKRAWNRMDIYLFKIRFWIMKIPTC